MKDDLDQLIDDFRKYVEWRLRGVGGLDDASIRSRYSLPSDLLIKVLTEVSNLKARMDGLSK